jgi:hypothetical protein
MHDDNKIITTIFNYYADTSIDKREILKWILNELAVNWLRTGSNGGLQQTQ